MTRRPRKPVDLTRAYGDNCPKFGSRHGQCVPCRAREALGAKEGE